MHRGDTDISEMWCTIRKMGGIQKKNKSEKIKKICDIKKKQNFGRSVCQGTK